jgi:hypothetical protein
MGEKRDIIPISTNFSTQLLKTFSNGNAREALTMLARGVRL